MICVSPFLIRILMPSISFVIQLGWGIVSLDIFFLLTYDLIYFENFIFGLFWVCSLEVYNRVTWDSLLLVTFQFINRYQQTLKVLPTPPKIPTTPFHTKKNNHIKKHIYKPQTFPITPLHTKKNNHIKKAYLQIWKYLYNPFYSNNFLKVTILLKK